MSLQTPYELRASGSVSELGALKEFKLRSDEQQATSRLKQEVDALREVAPGLPRLLDFNLKERWMVTEYFPNSTLENNHSKYKGDADAGSNSFSVAREDRGSLAPAGNRFIVTSNLPMCLCVRTTNLSWVISASYSCPTSLFA